ncbi:MAG: diguanylate cyclase [Thiotrichales bacterium]|nr:diguanylate cyclase [Thiotrichales bacterium]
MNEKIKIHQAEQLYSEARLAVFLSFLLLVVYYSITRNVVSEFSLSVFSGLFGLGILMRSISLWKFRHHEKNKSTISYWLWAHAFNSLLFGIAQAYLILKFDPAWPQNTQIEFSLVVVCVITITIRLYAAYYQSYLAFNLPIIASLIYLQAPSNIFDLSGYQNLTLMLIAFIAVMLLLLSSTYKNNIKRIKYELTLIDANSKLETLASRDPLTNLPNRRAFDEYFQSEWDRHKRSASMISLLIIDADFFKQYNDTYGHSAGDIVLIRLANHISECINRPADKVIRYGGEEFVVLLPDTSINGSIEVAERILKKVRELKIVHETSSINKIVTVSIGVATTDPTDDKIKEMLFEWADEQLYIAKMNGRNQLSCHGIMNQGSDEQKEIT